METRHALREQLDALSDLQSIVRTMKALSASSIHDYERAAVALEQYEETVKLGFAAALYSRSYTQLDAGLAPAATSAPVAVVFGSDHGLCGHFNETVADHLVAELDATTDHAPDDWRLLAIGMRLDPILAVRDRPADRIFALPGTVDEIATTVQTILQQLERWLPNQSSGVVKVIHNRPGEQLHSRAVTRTLLPLELQSLHRYGRREWPGPRLPQAFMAEPALLSALIRQHLFIRLFRACAASQASEHASRLDAMQRAESNLADRRESVTARYRRLRQDAITSELLDVVAGFEAVKGS